MWNFLTGFQMVGELQHTLCPFHQVPSEGGLWEDGAAHVGMRDQGRTSRQQKSILCKTCRLVNLPLYWAQ